MIQMLELTDYVLGTTIRNLTNEVKESILVTNEYTGISQRKINTTPKKSNGISRTKNEYLKFLKNH